jgi:hypothetical protein
LLLCTVRLALCNPSPPSPPLLRRVAQLRGSVNMFRRTPMRCAAASLLCLFSFLLHKFSSWRAGCFGCTCFLPTRAGARFSCSCHALQKCIFFFAQGKALARGEKEENK